MVDNVSFQGEIRPGKGLMVREPHRSPTSSKAGQLKQYDLRTTLWNQSAWTELYFPCFSPAFLVDDKMSPEQGAREEGRETQVLDKLSCRKWPPRPMARACNFIPENSIFPIWTVCIFSNDGEYRASSLCVKKVDNSQTWVICKRRHESQCILNTFGQ